MEKTYLIRCKKIVKGREVKYHLDWGWSAHFHKRVWTYSEAGARGHACKGLLLASQMKCLFAHFGLKGYKHNPKYKGVLGKSPAKLCALRRKCEAKEGLEHAVIKSHRTGQHFLAEEVT